MRYRVVATLASGVRLEASTRSRKSAYRWWGRLGLLDLGGPQAISLTQESDDEKDVILAIGRA